MSTQRETELSPEALAIIQQDFGKHSSRRIKQSGAVEDAVFRGVMGPVELSDRMSSRPLHLPDGQDLRLFPGNIVWFSEDGDTHERRKPYATPEDYLEIRDNPDSLNTFITERLDTGKIDTSFGGMGGEDLETNPAEYLTFLYTGSSHEPFRRNFGQAVVQLLAEELGLDLDNLGFDEARRRVGSSFSVLYGGNPDFYFNYSWTNHMAEEDRALLLLYLVDREVREKGEATVHVTYETATDIKDYSFLDRLGDQALRDMIEEQLREERRRGFLDYLRIGKDEKGQELRGRVTDELLTTYRIPTIDEYGIAKKWVIPPEQMDESYERGVKEGTIPAIPHFEELPFETKLAIINAQLNQDAQILLSRRDGHGFHNRYNRLSGLLEIVACTGVGNDQLSALYPALKEAIGSGKYHDLPDVKPATFPVNIENQLLLAISAIQPGKELRDFWLDRIANDSNKDRAVTAVNGLLIMPGESSDLKSEIPALVGALLQRRGDLEETRSYGSAISYQEKLIDTALEIIAARLYRGRPFHHFDQSAGTLDFLTSTGFKPGIYTYGFDRFNTEGGTNETVTYDLSSGEIQEGKDFAGSIQAHIDKEGLDLSSEVSMETLVGRRIASPSRSRLIEGLEESARGSFEGVMGLNGFDYAFLYDPRTGKLLFSKNMANVERGSGDQTWDGRKPKLKPRDRRIPCEDFVDLQTLGQEIDQRVKAQKDRRTIYGPEFPLDKRVISKLEPYIIAILDSRLVNHGQDRVK